MNSITKKPRTVTLPGIVLCGASILVGACASHNEAEPTSTNNEAKVEITFDSEGCPKLADPNDFVVDRSKFVVWQSVDEAGDNLDMRYDIYFDPFNGQPIESTPHGYKKVKIDKDAPATIGPAGIEYKYSVVGKKCVDEPLDPRFRLRR